jgi:NAD(P)H-dependent FMN reductase
VFAVQLLADWREFVSQGLVVQRVVLARRLRRHAIVHKIAIILGSTRPGRKGEHVATWAYEIARKRGDAEFELVDIAAFELPILDEAVPASSGVAGSVGQLKASARALDTIGAFLTNAFRGGNQMRLAGKRVLITGTGGGQGKAAQALFAREGARVIGCDLQQNAAERSAAELREYDVHGDTVDLTDAGAAQRWIEDSAERLGGIDVLYNNAAGFGSLHLRRWS